MGSDAGAVATDRLLGGRLLLRQPAQGHRAGTDAVLLAAAAPEAPAGDVVDLGAATGAVGLALAMRAPEARVRLVEIDPALAEIATENVRLNDVQGRVTVCATDVLAAAARKAAGLEDGSADLVLTNPPYLDAARARSSPQAGRALAQVIPEGGLAGRMKAAGKLLRPKGILIAIHRADATPALLAACEGRLGAISVLPVHPRADQPASRVLLRAVKGSRGPFTLHPGLVLHDAGGTFTPLAEAVHRGEALVPW